MTNLIQIKRCVKQGVHNPILCAFDQDGYRWVFKGLKFRLDDPKLYQLQAKVRERGSIDPAYWYKAKNS